MLQMMGMPAGYSAQPQQFDPRSMAALGMSQQAQGAYFPAATPMSPQATHQSQTHRSSALADSANLSSTSASGFKYMSEQIVMAVGQYREVRPSVAPSLLASGSCRFRADPAELPAGLQLDPATGIIWGTPLPPTEELAGTNGYRYYTVFLVGPGVKASTNVGIKVVHFRRDNFKITHVSQLDRNKYMVLIDSRKQP